MGDATTAAPVLRRLPAFPLPRYPRRPSPVVPSGSGPAATTLISCSRGGLAVKYRQSGRPGSALAVYPPGAFQRGLEG